MDIFVIIIGIIGAFASAGTIWDFITVRQKKKIARDGINIEKFKENIPSSYFLDEKYRIPDESDLSKGDWSWVYDGESLPFITSGNFFGDGKLAEAIVLINKENEQPIIVVKKHGESSSIELMSPLCSPYNIQLRTVPIGEYKGHWEKLDLKLEVHGIRVSFLETSEVIMYWDKEVSKFKKYWTAD